MNGFHWDGRPRPAGVVHQMVIRLLIGNWPPTILEAESEMVDIPHDLCRTVAETIQKIVGVPVSAGFSDQIKQRLGGLEGCSHFTHLISSHGPGHPSWLLDAALQEPSTGAQVAGRCPGSVHPGQQLPALEGKLPPDSTGPGDDRSVKSTTGIISTRGKVMKKYDLIVLGTGPAGLQAAIDVARAKVSVLSGGRQPRSSLFRAHIENYCCLAGVTGEDLLLEGQRQAEKFGALFLNEDVVEVSADESSGFQVKTESGEALAAAALLLCMGISRNKLNVPGEKDLLGRGVSYCVDCDANFFRGLPVAVVGFGSAAASGALTLLFYASRVHLVTGRAGGQRTADRTDPRQLHRASRGGQG